MRSNQFVSVAVSLFALSAPIAGAEPDHPVITEVYTDPGGANDGAAGRDPGNAHQEYIEIYLPTCADLNVALDCDALNITFYEVEGDHSSSGFELVNYRFDLPTFDLDAGNGLSGIARPSSGVVVLGWVDYQGNPPVGLLSPTTALIQNGLTAPPADFVFIPINGLQFAGQSTFPDLLDQNLIDLPAEASSGVVQNGSGAYLLVNRDAVGYVELCDDQHSGDCTAGSDPDLPDNGQGLASDALMDGLAVNDDPLFDVLAQPYSLNCDPQIDPLSCIDLEPVLPAGGAFSLLVPQLPETTASGPSPGQANGYARLYIDVEKTTESGASDNPVQDALNAYRHIRNDGPFFATPGVVTLTTSAPELGLASNPPDLQVLASTTLSSNLLAANVGGDFPIDMAVTSIGPSSDPEVMFSAGPGAGAVPGQSYGLPGVVITASGAAVHEATATAEVTVTATNTSGGDPRVQNAIRSSTVSATVINPTSGLNAAGQPFETTVFIAVQGIPGDVGVDNEFLLTDLGQFLAEQPDVSTLDTEGHGTALVDPDTNLNDSGLIPFWIKEMPEEGEECTNWLNAPGAAGTPALSQVVETSAEVASGASSYDFSIAECGDTGETVIKGIRLNVPDTVTFGGAFSPGEALHFIDPTGDFGGPQSGLSNVRTDRTFEIAVVDTALRFNGTLESGQTDDFGILVEVKVTEAGAPVSPGDFIFLSFMGGLQGADIDSLNVPPGGNLATIILFDLDNLHDELGIISIEALYFVDAGEGGSVDPIEAFSLNLEMGCKTNGDCDDGLFCNGTESCSKNVCQSGIPPQTDDGVACTVDSCDEDADAVVHDPDDVACENGAFCDGTESCDIVSGCQSSGDPCVGQGMVCNEMDDTCVDAVSCPGGTAAECPTDDCTWCECVAGQCNCITRSAQGDIGGNNGACQIDGACDGNDRFHALNCFSNVDTLGAGGYPCELNPPSAINVDAGGPGIDCARDGVCDGNDAFHALNCFSNIDSAGDAPYPCSCAPTPQPPTGGRSALRPVHAGLSLRAPESVTAGAIVEVDVYLDTALSNLRGYQLHVEVGGGYNGSWDLVDVLVKTDHRRLALDRTTTYWKAFNRDTRQMVVGTDDVLGRPVTAGAYLGTYTYRVPLSASGTFVVDVLHEAATSGGRTFLFGRYGRLLFIDAVAPARVLVQSSRLRTRAIRD